MHHEKFSAYVITKYCVLSSLVAMSAMVWERSNKGEIIVIWGIFKQSSTTNCTLCHVPSYTGYITLIFRWVDSNRLQEKNVTSICCYFRNFQSNRVTFLYTCSNKYSALSPVTFCQRCISVSVINCEKIAIFL